MKPFLSVAIITFLANCALAQVQASKSPEKVVGPGVTWSHEFNPEGPMNYNVLKVELDNPHVTLEAESGKGRLYAGEKVLQTVLREEQDQDTEIIAGVNADFWSNSRHPFQPIGLLVADGMIHNLPSRTRSAFVLTKTEEPHIGPVSLQVSVKTGDHKLDIDRINSGITEQDDTILFTPPYGDEVPPARGQRFILKTSGGEFLPNQPLQVQLIPADPATTTSLSASQFVLHVPLSAASRVRDFSKQQDATLSAVMPEVAGVVATVTGGGPALLSKGRVDIATEEGLSGSFSETRHPRTALGYSKDRKTLYLVTVDGRQPRVSIGASLDELAQYMLKLGCWEAINLDGGGSTTMVVGEKVVNNPSDFFGPRTVANSLLVVASDGAGEPTTLSFDPSGDPLYAPVGSTMAVSISALDQNAIPVELPADAVVKVSDSRLVTNSVLNAKTVKLTFSTTPGEGKIRFQCGTATGELAVKLVKLDELRLEPHVVVLGSGDSIDLHVIANAEGHRIQLTPEAVQLASKDKSVLDISGVTAKGKSRGKTDIVVKVGTETRRFPAFVDLARSVMIENFDAPDDLTDFSGSGFDEKATTVELEKGAVKEGTAALRLNYKMTRDEKTRINLPVGRTLNQAPAAFALQVYGDGKEAWLRANIVDNNGVLFIADFTNGADGITWQGEWRRLSVPFDSLIGTDFKKSPTPELPFTIREIVVAQDQDALKTSGSILLDGFEALYPPQ